MAQQWFYEKDGYQYGPLTSQQMQVLAHSGKLDPEDLVWREGMQTKLPAAKYKGLLPERSVTQSDPPADSTEVVIESGSANRGRSSRSMRSSGLSVGAIFSLGMGTQSFVYKNWISVAFLTLVFILSCAGASGLIICLPLMPVFMMGYISNLDRIRQGEAIHWEDFIKFLWRGWPALFNLLEVVVVFILITAVVSVFLCLFGIVLFFISLASQALGSGTGLVFLLVFGLPVGLLGLALGLGAATAYWSIVYAAKEEERSSSPDELSIYSRLQLGLRAINANKGAVFIAGACIALFTLAYGIVLALIWFLAGLLVQELPWSRSGQILRQLMTLVAVIVSFFLGSSGLASFFAYHAFVAERIVEHFRSTEE